MNLIQTRAIVGPAFDYREADQMIHLLTREAGRISIAVPGIKSSRGRRAGILQNLAEIEATFHLREGAEAARLDDASLLDEHTGLRGDVDRLALASFLLDLGLDAAETGHAAPALYDAVSLGLSQMEAAVESPPLTLAARWALRILTIAGIEPCIDEALLNGAWRRKGGGARPEHFYLDVAGGVIRAGARPATDAGEIARGGASAGPRKMAVGGARLRGGELGGADRLAPLEPPAVRAVYENLRAPSAELPDLPSLAPAAAIELLRALAALAAHHLGMKSKSMHFLEQTVFSRFSLDNA